MLTSIHGVLREGRIELLEPAPPAPSGRETRVLVTFLDEAGSVDLRQHGIDERQAADLRSRLRTFEEDWNRPEMSAYDTL